MTGKMAFGLTLLACGFAQAKAPTQVQIYVGELLAAGPTKPIEKLAQALKNDKTSARFRIVWSLFGSMSNCRATILYDRKNHTLKHYSSGSRKISDDPEEWIAEQYSSIYHSVNDQMIFRLQKQVTGVTEYQPEEAYFSKLASLGCRKEGILYKSRRFKP